MILSLMRRLFLSCVSLLCFFLVNAQNTAFNVVDGRASLVLGRSSKPVMLTAARMLQSDWSEVFGRQLSLSDHFVPRYDATPRIIAAVVGDSLLDGLGVDFSGVRGTRQAFVLSVTSRGDLVVAGADPHGVAYGLMHLSRLIGVSPWEWWAESRPAHLSDFSLKAGYRFADAPKVEFRGIFINDEDWGLTPWSWQTNDPAPKGTVGPSTTERIFQLLLRLRANTYWPPMHACSRPFFLTPGNREVAEQYGIYIGSSHCEPMACNANGEWAVRGSGEYNFKYNRDAVIKFWEDRVADVSCQEVLYTLGMRGVHDSGILGAKSTDERKILTQEVIDAQRQIIKRLVNPDAASVPQVFIPYKEVLDAYNAGMAIPDDVCLMWCDDNYGYIRHFPTESERARIGGNGVYYHASYWGRPHDYLWLGSFSPALMIQQMLQAYDSGIQRLWILNVGDIKPLEYQTELFLDLAWNPDQVRALGTSRHLSNFLSREFGPKAAMALTPALMEHYRLCFVAKPEFLGHTRTEEKDPAFKVVSDMPWPISYVDSRLALYDSIAKSVSASQQLVDSCQSTAFFHLVGYPVLAAQQMNVKMLNAMKARHSLASFSISHVAEDSIRVLTDRYNSGRWAGFMDAAPRRLPVFAPVDESLSSQPLVPDPVCVARLAASDARRGSGFISFDGLGYSGCAALLPQGRSASFQFSFGKDFAALDSIVVELRMLPTHPVPDGAQVAVSVQFDDAAPVTIDYHTEGRSEEWKLNVLSNQAVRSVAFPVSKARRHSLSISALSPSVVFDEARILPIQNNL